MAQHLAILNPEKYRGEEDYSDISSVVSEIKKDFNKDVSLLNGNYKRLPDDYRMSEFEHGVANPHEEVYLYKYPHSLEHCYNSFEVHIDSKEKKLLEIYYVA